MIQSVVHSMHVLFVWGLNKLVQQQWSARFHIVRTPERLTTNCEIVEDSAHDNTEEPATNGSMCPKARLNVWFRRPGPEGSTIQSKNRLPDLQRLEKRSTPQAWGVVHVVQKKASWIGNVWAKWLTPQAQGANHVVRNYCRSRSKRFGLNCWLLEPKGQPRSPTAMVFYISNVRSKRLTPQWLWQSGRSAVA